MKRRETIEQQAKSYTLAVFDKLEDFSDVTQAYIDGAEWMQETMIEKATQWLFENVYDYLNPEDQERVESFSKYLEE
jgi:hypothetical protein